MFWSDEVWLFDELYCRQLSYDPYMDNVDFTPWEDEQVLIRVASNS
jgi:hypothetical protein